MKYTYAYKTSDGQRHEAAMEADSREAVFTSLRKQGIKAIKVVAADGSKANGEVRGIRKRVFALSAVCLVLCAIAASVMSFRAGEHSNIRTFSNSNISPSAPRHQIYGDPAVMAAFEQGDFAGVFDEPGDQLLAWFAQPGKLMCPPNANASACTEKTASNLLALVRLDTPSRDGSFCRPDAQRTGRRQNDPSQFAVRDSALAVKESDSREVVELKQIVNGMREELSAYLANGNGTVYSYWRRLNERLAEEQQIYERTKRELEADPSPALRAERNAALRNLGLRTIPAPKK